MMQQPPTGGGAVHPSMDQQQQQHHQPQQQYSASPQPQPTTSIAQEEEEDTLWIGDLQNWMDKVEKKEIRTLWIGDLQHWMDEDYIRRCFAHTDEVFTSKVIRNKKTGKSECYGFIEFKSRAAAKTFLHKFNGTPMPGLAGRNFSLNLASSSSSSSSSFGSGGEKKQQQQQQQQQLQEEEDCAADDLITISVVGDDDLAAAASDIVTPYFMFPQETFTTVKHLERENSSWEDLLKWSSVAQGSRTPGAVHAAHLVYAIGAVFKRPYRFFENRGLTPKEFEELLDKLQECVDSIDIAKELHSIDALNALISKLGHQHADIRAKAAKLIGTMAQKHPSSRQLVIELGGDGLLYDTFLLDRHSSVVTNALEAISSLYWNDGSGISAFGVQDGYAGLIKIFETQCVESHRRLLILIVRLVTEHNSDYDIVTALKYPSIMMRLASSVDAEVRKAALRFLSVLAGVEKGGNSAQLVKNDDKLKQFLRERMEGISAMAPEDLGAAREEIELLDSLWNACYDEPSSLALLCNLVRIDTPASDTPLYP